VQPPGNHQVKHKPEIVLDSKCDAFADSAQFLYDLPLRTLKRRLSGSQKKGARHAYVLQWLTNDARFKSGKVRGDIW
jgi:hypothetical protein